MLYRLFKEFYRNERGASSIEYVFLMALVALFAVVAFSQVGGSTKNLYQTVANISDAEGIIVHEEDEADTDFKSE